MGCRETPTALPGFRDLSALTHTQRYALRYLLRWGTMFGKPVTMEALRDRGLVEQCGAYGKLQRWRLTPDGRELEGLF